MVGEEANFENRAIWREGGMAGVGIGVVTARKARLTLGGRHTTAARALSSTEHPFVRSDRTQGKNLSKIV